MLCLSGFELYSCWVPLIVYHQYSEESTALRKATLNKTVTNALCIDRLACHLIIARKNQIAMSESMQQNGPKVLTRRNAKEKCQSKKSLIHLLGELLRRNFSSAKSAPQQLPQKVKWSFTWNTLYSWHRIFPILTVNQSKWSIKRLSQLCTNQNFRALARNLC